MATSSTPAPSAPQDAAASRIGPARQVYSEEGRLAELQELLRVQIEGARESDQQETAVECGEVARRPWHRLEGCGSGNWGKLENRHSQS